MCWVCLFLICLGSHLPCCSFACFSFALRCVASHLSVSHLPCFSFAYAPLSCLEPATCPALCMLWIMRTLNAVLIRFVGKQVGGGVLTWGVRRGINFLISGDGQLLNWRKCSPLLLASVSNHAALSKLYECTLCKGRLSCTLWNECNVCIKCFMQ